MPTRGLRPHLPPIRTVYPRFASLQAPVGQTLTQSPHQMQGSLLNTGLLSSPMMIAPGTQLLAQRPQLMHSSLVKCRVNRTLKTDIVGG